LDSTVGHAYLVLPDGGQVSFQASLYSTGQNSYYEHYQNDAIFDSINFGYSLQRDEAGKLTAVYDIMGGAGHWLKIYYKVAGTATVIDHVYGGYTNGSTDVVTQKVTYSYTTQSFAGASYTLLTGATYGDNTSAAYTYQASNILPSGTPLIKSCDDLRYPGPLKKISYDFVPGGFYGQLFHEKNFIGTLNVATLAISGNSRTETRGGGKTRTFTYNAAIATTPVQHLQYLLASRTDFDPSHPATVYTYDANGFVASIKDPNLNTTSFTHVPSTGAIKTVTHPAVAGEGTATIK
jgi:YD repeat-containing protein